MKIDNYQIAYVYKIYIELRYLLVVLLEKEIVLVSFYKNKYRFMVVLYKVVRLFK